MFDAKSGGFLFKLTPVRHGGIFGQIEPKLIA